MQRSKRRYLSGCDWLLTGLQRMAEQVGRLGNHFQIVLELEGTLDSERFRRQVGEFCTACPLVSGRVRRAWNLAPYWHPAAKPPARELRATVVELPPGLSFTETSEALAKHLNAPCSTPVNGLAFSILLAGDEKTFLVLHFDHRLFDALGAERFIRELADYLAGRSSRPLAAFTTTPMPANLRPWKEKFDSGKVVNRLRLAQRAFAPCQLPCRPTGESAPFRFSRIVLPPDEARALATRANREAGYLMTTPYLTSLAMRAFNHVAAKRDAPLAGLVVPCTVSLPRSDALFFNHLSFVCLSSTTENLRAADGARQLAGQFYRQIQAGMPAHFENVWKLLRIVPATPLGWLLRGPMRAFFGSFCLAHVGDGLSSLDAFAGQRVLNAWHMPFVPPVPGVGFFANGFQGTLNLCVASFNGVLAKDEHAELVAALRRQLSPDASQTKPLETVG